MTKQTSMQTFWAFHRSRFYGLLLLGCWFVLALGLRLTLLASKPVWSDEFATLVFSLGHRFRSLPFDVPISLDTLLSPLRLDSTTSIASVPENLFRESNHPPVYFMLTHLWVKLFGQDGDFVSIWGARSLSAILGAATVPAMFALAWLAFRSALVAQMAAALMAISPYGVYLAQEARHYTLAVIFIIASLGCLITTILKIQQKNSLPVWIGLLWVIINTLGIAVHFFVVFTLAAEGLVMLAFWLKSCQFQPFKIPPWKTWRGVYIAAVGSAVGGLVWLPIFLNISNPDSELIRWTFHGDPVGDFLEPIVRLIAWISTMIVILPVENQPLSVIVLSGLMILGVVVLTGKLLKDSLLLQPQHWRWPQIILAGFITSAILMILTITYGFSMDLTLVARYHFTYFPAIILLVAAAFAVCWEIPGKYYWRQKGIVLIGCVGLIGAFTVATHLAYQKPDRSDLAADYIAASLTPNIPTLIATVHKSHEQTGEMMSIAWELKRLGITENLPQFLLAQKLGNPEIPMTTLSRTIDRSSRPVNLWLINFSAPFEPEMHNCSHEPDFKSEVPGYHLRMYRCLSSKQSSKSGNFFV
ncbi:hypothetical protein VB854_00385 [Limnoraphis robusta CCNP1315]|uniref:Glycosyltransferase RgtA/B/C/D-like domain-containing protein n=2 Tax=Limnoraphis TaxID=1332112 RepID=A0ABU5TR72_9CYAN|nr:hypothetical protein [Limnoraphis robusta]MEA5517396.1 hypothetical protein [Limnoraphis robusta CCNP1315]MEA5546016.1 hypothetical protein [Limnoraphis robusta CCNP1324]